MTNQNQNTFVNKAAYANKALARAVAMSATREAAKSSVRVDKSTREDLLVKKFLSNVRTLRNYKPKDNRQNLKRSIAISKAIKEVNLFIIQNYFKDNNTFFDLYLAITNKDYVKSYMANISVNDRVRELYLKPRNIEIIFNTETFMVEAVFNGKEHVNLYFGSVYSLDTYGVIYEICYQRASLEKHYKSLVLENNGLHIEQDMKNYCLAHIAHNVVNEPEVVIAQWLLDNNIALTVEDFIYAYTTPHCMRVLVRDGIGMVDMSANPLKYDPQTLSQARSDSSTHQLADGVSMHVSD